MLKTAQMAVLHESDAKRNEMSEMIFVMIEYNRRKG